MSDAAAAPRFPWGDLALAPLNGVLAAVPAVALAGLPLYLAMWVAGVSEPGRWASFVGVSAFGLAVASAFYVSIAAFLRARARVDDDLHRRRGRRAGGRGERGDRDRRPIRR